MFIIRCRETGDKITEWACRADAENCVNYYAKQDMLDEMPEWKSEEWESGGWANPDMEAYKDFYEIIEEDE